MGAAAAHRDASPRLLNDYTRGHGPLDARRHSLGAVRPRAKSIPRSCASSRRRAWSSRMARDYAEYLCGVFPTIRSSRTWRGAGAPKKSGTARRSAAGRCLADPGFDHGAAAARFTAGFRVDVDATRSSARLRAGELVARCIVETGTSSYYTALVEAAEEPVLKIDLPAHRRRRAAPLQALLQHMQRYLAMERSEPLAAASASRSGASPSRGRRARLCLLRRQRRREPYDRRRCARPMRAAPCGVYRWHHVERAIAMVFKAAGLRPHGRFNMFAAHLAWWGMQKRAARLERNAA